MHRSTRRLNTRRHPPRSSRAHIVAAIAALSAPVPGARAQQPPQPAVIPVPVTPQIPAYRAPTIALVQPLSGGTVPQDRPVVVIRYVQGEPTDPLDPRSFHVTVDGRDRTALFQVLAGEAWGPITDAVQNDDARAAAAHQLSIRICSSRGACASAEASVIAVPPPERTRPYNDSRREKLLDVLLAATRRLLLK